MLNRGGRGFDRFRSDVAAKVDYTDDTDYGGIGHNPVVVIFDGSDGLYGRVELTARSRGIFRNGSLRLPLQNMR